MPILEFTKDGKVVHVYKETFSMYDYKGLDVKGDKYYVNKAVSLGANKPKPPKKTTNKD